ncbi:MAG TPA: hypothetical protein VGI10_06225 [Polyangiaceae bacterium]|jgi:hypothetical protein
MLRTVEQSIAAGWQQTRSASRCGCVSCPCCDTLIDSTDDDGSTVCHGCQWKEGEPVDRDRPSIHNEAGRKLRAEKAERERLEAEDLQRQVKFEIWTNGYLCAQSDALTGNTTPNPYAKAVE